MFDYLKSEYNNDFQIFKEFAVRDEAETNEEVIDTLNQ